MRNVDSNTYVNYFVNFANLPCSNLTEDFFLGRVLILGSPKQKPFKNTVPTLVAVEVIIYHPVIISKFLFNILQGAGGAELSATIPVTACYTEDSECRFQCPRHSNALVVANLPSPGLVHQLPNVGKYHNKL